MSRPDSRSFSTAQRVRRLPSFPTGFPFHVCDRNENAGPFEEKAAAGQESIDPGLAREGIALFHAELQRAAAGRPVSSRRLSIYTALRRRSRSKGDRKMNSLPDLDRSSNPRFETPKRS